MPEIEINSLRTGRKARRPQAVFDFFEVPQKILAALERNAGGQNVDNREVDDP